MPLSPALHIASPGSPRRLWWAAALCSLALLALAVAVHTGLTQPLDDAVAAALLPQRSELRLAALRWWTDLHDPWVLGPLTAALSAFACWRGQRRWAAVALLSVPGVLLLNLALKHLFARARPDAAEALVLLHTYSFPSGHAAGAAAFHALWCAWAMTRLRSPATRAAAVATALVAVMLVALSRLVLGVHYLSDTVGGALEALAWLCACLLATRRLSDAPRAS